MKMKWDNHGLKTPLARARGLGAASGAVEGWIKLRVTAIGNAILLAALRRQVMISRMLVT